jgi:hypothetical protein
MKFLTEEDKKELETMFKETLYQKFAKPKNPEGLHSLDIIMKDVINRLDVDIDKIIANDKKYIFELSSKLDSMLLEQISKADNLSEVLEEKETKDKKNKKT